MRPKTSLHIVIRNALRRAGIAGMNRTAISALFGRNRSADELQVALMMLVDTGEARADRYLPGRKGGRPIEIWFARLESVNEIT